jgi:regulator of RNase E activity RraA
MSYKQRGVYPRHHEWLVSEVANVADEERDVRRDLISRLEAIPYTGAIIDILQEAGYHDQGLPWQIQAVTPVTSVVGRALTMVGEPLVGGSRDDYFVPFLEMLGAVREGDVLISQPNDATCAHLGELSSETAQSRGARGAVIDGGVRDVDYISKLGFPVFARYTTPIDIVGRWALTEYNVPITIGNVEIAPGDYIVGDIDGVVVIPQDIAADVTGKAEAVVDTENLVRRDILAGMHPVDAYRAHGRF